MDCPISLPQGCFIQNRFPLPWLIRPWAGNRWIIGIFTPLGFFRPFLGNFPPPRFRITINGLLGIGMRRWKLGVCVLNSKILPLALTWCTFQNGCVCRSITCRVKKGSKCCGSDVSQGTAGGGAAGAASRGVAPGVLGSSPAGSGAGPGAPPGCRCGLCGPGRCGGCCCWVDGRDGGCHASRPRWGQRWNRPYWLREIYAFAGGIYLHPHYTALAGNTNTLTLPFFFLFSADFFQHFLPILSRTVFANIPHALRSRVCPPT